MICEICRRDENEPHPMSARVGEMFAKLGTKVDCRIRHKVSAPHGWMCHPVECRGDGAYTDMTACSCSTASRCCSTVALRTT